MVDAVNVKRRAIYAERAKEQGTAADRVGRVYARQILHQGPGGDLVPQGIGEVGAQVTGRRTE